MSERLVESMHETVAHIKRVQSLLHAVAANLLERARIHDASKLVSPEAETFAEYTHRLKGMTYGSNEYKSCLAEMKPALDHHYEMNRHHPEHWTGGIDDMTLVDLIEMLCDWKAATERHADGDIRRSVELNQKRFNVSDQLTAVFRRTVEELWPKHLETFHCFGCGCGGNVGNFCCMCGAGRKDYGVDTKDEL